VVGSQLNVRWYQANLRIRTKKKLTKKHQKETITEIEKKKKKKKKKLKPRMLKP
jgi:hypothetical protein